MHMYFLAWWLIEIRSQEIVCYICTEKLESHLAFIFDLQRMMNSVLHREKAK